MYGKYLQSNNSYLVIGISELLTLELPQMAIIKSIVVNPILVLKQPILLNNLQV